MVVNIFETIKNILNFDGKSVYLVWLVMRNKDGNTDIQEFPEINKEGLTLLYANLVD